MIRSKPKSGDKTTIDLAQLADAMCRYDLDQLDVHWLQEINKERRLMGNINYLHLKCSARAKFTDCHKLITSKFTII